MHLVLSKLFTYSFVILFVANKVLKTIFTTRKLVSYYYCHYLNDLHWFDFWKNETLANFNFNIIKFQEIFAHHMATLGKKYIILLIGLFFIFC